MRPDFRQQFAQVLTPVLGNHVDTGFPEKGFSIFARSKQVNLGEFFQFGQCLQQQALPLSFLDTPGNHEPQSAVFPLFWGHRGAARQVRQAVRYDFQIDVRPGRVQQAEQVSDGTAGCRNTYSPVCDAVAPLPPKGFPAGCISISQAG